MEALLAAKNFFFEIFVFVVDSLPIRAAMFDAGRPAGALRRRGVM